MRLRLDPTSPSGISVAEDTKVVSRGGHGIVAKDITGMLTAGTNITLTGNGTTSSPYRIAATGGGGGGGDLSTVVPYTGATSDVTLGVHSIHADTMYADNFYTDGDFGNETFFGIAPGTVAEHTTHIQAGDGVDGVTAGSDVMLHPGLFGGYTKIRYFDGREIIFDLDGVSASRVIIFPDRNVNLGDLEGKADVSYVDAAIAGVTAGTGLSRSVNSISTPTTAGATDATDYVYLVSGTTTLTLPTAVGNTNRYSVKNTGSATVTIATTSSQTIDGSATATLPVQYTSVDLISDGSNWNVL